MPQQPSNVKLPPGYEDATPVENSSATVDKSVKLPSGYEDAVPVQASQVEQDTEALNNQGVITPKPGESFEQTMGRARAAAPGVTQDAVDYNEKRGLVEAPIISGGLAAGALAPELAGFVAAHPQVFKGILRETGKAGLYTSIWELMHHIFTKGKSQ